MPFVRSRILFSLTATVLLAGCAGSAPDNGQDTLFRVPSANPPPYAPPVSESYVIQRAPEPLVQNYAPVRIMPVPPPVGQVVPRTEILRNETTYAPFEARAETVEEAIAPPPPDKAAQADARAAIAEAEAVALATELAKARAAIAEAERETAAAESRKLRDIRDRVAQLSAERAKASQKRAEQEQAKSTVPDRANPSVPDRPVLGRFATRGTGDDRADQQRPAGSPPPAQSEVVVAPPAPPPEPRPLVERAPIPGLKPYILARSALPATKPRRAPPQRTFDVGQAPVLKAPDTPATALTNASIPREPGGDLSARFFPTPGKPSTLGTGQDTALDLVAIDAVPYGVGTQLEAAIDDEAAGTDWADAVTLIENGEVEALAILEDADLVLTLCSGRSILTTPPDLAAAATLTAPQIICGQNKPLALR